VDDDAGRVERAPQRRPPSRRELGLDEGRDVARIAPATNRLPGAVERRPRAREDELARLAGEANVAQQLVHGGQIAQLHPAAIVGLWPLSLYLYG
jgi:hypothetical protein